MTSAWMSQNKKGVFINRAADTIQNSNIFWTYLSLRPAPARLAAPTAPLI